ncbi:MAG: hypothetical protein OEV66_01445 [Spirochaetia bacterium]|nr:hypothetical protein [Spirochaetia bacterium]
MVLWVGLGNPGKKYAKTRHNIGAAILGKLFPEIQFQFHKPVNGFLAEDTKNGIKHILLIPQTFMNLSGDAVSKTMKFYKVQPENMVVLMIKLSFRQVKFNTNSEEVIEGITD